VTARDFAQGDSSAGLMPMSVDYLANSVTGPSGHTWEIYYGTVNADARCGRARLG
jgi:hypothetical protein